MRVELLISLLRDWLATAQLSYQGTMIATTRNTTSAIKIATVRFVAKTLREDELGTAPCGCFSLTMIPFLKVQSDRTAAAGVGEVCAMVFLRIKAFRGHASRLPIWKRVQNLELNRPAKYEVQT